MKMGEYIKQLRTDQGLSQEDLGKKLNPPINRAAVNKWETGQVENIKRSYIEQMSAMFGVRAESLMCFEQQINEELIAIEQVQKCFGRKAVKLLEGFTMLNDQGKAKVLEYIEDVQGLTKYLEHS